jgi:hypothetical protein
MEFLFCQPANKEKANAHLAHLQAPTHKLNLQLAKEPNFFRRTRQDAEMKIVSL